MYIVTPVGPHNEVFDITVDYKDLDLLIEVLEGSRLVVYYTVSTKLGPISQDQLCYHRPWPRKYPKWKLP